MEEEEERPRKGPLPPLRINLGATPNPDLLGHVVAEKYTLVGLIGRGGMGAVYEARHTQTGKRCAVKLLVSPELALNEELVRRFYREARASSAVESEHIVQVFDSGSDSYTGFPYMVMEYLDGEDLEQTVRRVGPLDPWVAGRIALQAAHGLAKAHQVGIVHRDIKTANIFLHSRDTGGLVAKILDFGIAKIKMEGFAKNSSGALGQLTRTGSMLGTPLYMSPEQARGASKVDARSDVWSLGVVMYNLLSGRLPFEGMTALGELLIAILQSDIPHLQDRAPWVPPELAEVTHKAMSRDLNQRYQNGSELRDALAKLIPGTPLVTREMLVPLAQETKDRSASKLTVGEEHLRASLSNVGTAVTTASAVESKPRPVWLVPVIAASALAIVGGGLLFLRRSAPERQVTVGLTQSGVSSVSAPGASQESKTFPLDVAPEGVEVKVDGVLTAVDQGKIQLSGAPGTARSVRLDLQGQTLEQTVAITVSGLVPTRLALPTPVSSSPASVPTKGSPGSTKSKADQPSSKGDKPAVKKGPDKVSTDTSEFN